MTGGFRPGPSSVEVTPYDPRWPALYAAERDRLFATLGTCFLAFEHIGSTAVPGQRAKPIIDMMAAVGQLSDLGEELAVLQAMGYHALATGMRERLFLRRRDPAGQVFHLHVVEHHTWEGRKERWMRDFLWTHPGAVAAYGELKANLAALHVHDVAGYTRSKTAFLQDLMDRMRDERGLPRVDVWED